MRRYFNMKFSRGGEFKAEMLDSVAPETCQAFCEAAPLAGSVLPASFSGHVMVLKKEIDYKKIENPVVFGAQPGDIFLNTNANQSVFEGEIIPPRVIVAYGSAVTLWNWGGHLPSNHFARIVEGEIKDLWEIGRRLRWEGKEDIQCTLL